MSAGPLRLLSTVQQAHVARPGDPYLRCELGDGSPSGPELRGYASDRLPAAVALIRTRWADDRLNAVVLGAPDDAAALAEAVLLAEPEVGFAMLPRGARAPVAAGHALQPRPSWSWDWMWTTSAPATRLPVEESVVLLDDDEPVRTLLAAAYPNPGRAPGHPHLAGWAGVWDGDRLGACATWEWHRPGHAHLSTIVVAPDLRGRGIGAAVTAALTRQLLDPTVPGPTSGPPLGSSGTTPARTVALGVYPDNVGAIRLYHRLGFVTGARFDTWATRD